MGDQSGVSLLPAARCLLGRRVPVVARKATPAARISRLRRRDDLPQASQGAPMSLLNPNETRSSILTATTSPEGKPTLSASTGAAHLSPAARFPGVRPW
jgi:hypothetical protein